MERVQTEEEQRKRASVRNDVLRVAKEAVKNGGLNDTHILIADVEHTTWAAEKREARDIAPTWSYVFVKAALLAKVAMVDWPIVGQDWYAESYSVEVSGFGRVSILAFNRAAYAKAFAKPAQDWLREQFPNIDFAEKFAKQKGTIPLIVAKPRSFSFERIAL